MRFPLYNPRQDLWEEHFVWSPDGTQIIGLTPYGRVTIQELNLNSKLAVTVRRNWVKAGLHPPSIE